MTAPTPETARRPWTRDELLLTLNLYGRLPFGRMHRGAPEVIALARLVGRTPSAIALRLGNFASMDPSLQSRGIRGMQNAGQAAAGIWLEYLADPEGVTAESERLLAAQALTERPASLPIDPEIVGREREALVKQRVNQAYFRRLVLARYEAQCCLTGLDDPRLLVAAHIVPWAEAPELRVDPRNGLCLGALHDRAFEVGILTIDAGYRVHVDDRFASSGSERGRAVIVDLHGRELHFSGELRPSPELLERHRAKFVGV